MQGITQEDVELRYKVIGTFIAHTGPVMRMLINRGELQPGNEKVPIYCSYDNRFQIFPQIVGVQHPLLNINLPAGGWIDWGERIFGFDIISFRAYQLSKSYKEALVEIYDAFGSKEHLRDGDREDDTIKWHTQQCNSILYDQACIDDQFYMLFNRQVPPYTPPSFCYYFNRHGAFIGKVVKFKNCENEDLKIIYTIWRREDNTFEKFVSFPPEKPYMIYNQDIIGEHTNKVIFVHDEFNIENYLHDNYGMFGLYTGETVFSACPRGLANLRYADLAPLKNKKIMVFAHNPFNNHDYVDVYNYEFIEELNTECKKFSIELVIAKPTESGIQEIAAESILELPEMYGLTAPIEIQGEVKIDGLSLRGEELQNADRKTVMLLNPIIESGTITWLYAEPKIGKTLMGLCIAYAVEKGSKSVGKWNSLNEKRKVLYVDGEMPKNRAYEHIKRIMRGFGDNWQTEKLPFLYFSFREARETYKSIMDDRWQNDLKTRIAESDLVILDNYQSLNDNALDPNPFIDWLKAFTKNDVAFLVLDHTNREGELQGSLQKIRNTDLTIRLERVANNQNAISISYPEDRYGVELKCPPHTLIKCFEGDSFKFIPDTTQNDEEKTPLSDSAKTMFGMWAYLLFLQKKGRSWKEIMAETGIHKTKLFDTLAFFNKDWEELTDRQKKANTHMSQEHKALVMQIVASLHDMSDEARQKFWDDLASKEKLWLAKSYC
jgi:hypothetical protein